MENFSFRRESPIPEKSGIGLRSPHYREILTSLPQTGWLEVHTENFFGEGGQPLYFLERIRSHYPMSFHGVGMFLGSTNPLDKIHLTKTKSLVDRFQPIFVSEHLCWGTVSDVVLNDLLPLPYTEESLDHVCQKVCQVQEFLKRQILVENVSSYLQYAQSSIPEWEFLAEVGSRTGCGILLDVNNLYVSSVNHSYNPEEFLQALPNYLVKENHLAGFETNQGVLIDTHSRPVSQGVWEIYRRALQLFGKVPTLVEWDANIPSLDILINEARKADSLKEELHGVIA
jgi:uncharacterized protein